MNKYVTRTMIGIGGPALSVFLYAQWLNLPPPVDSPLGRLPLSSEFDALRAAARLEVKSDVVADALETYTTSGRNHFTLGEKAALVALNEPALSAARKALRTPDSIPLSSRVSAGEADPRVFENLSNLFALDSYVKAVSANVPGAVDSGLDAIALAITLPRGGALNAELAGIKLEQASERSLWGASPYIGGPAAMAAARRLQKIMDTRFPFSGTVLQQKWQGEAEYASKFHDASTFALFDDFEKSNAPVLLSPQRTAFGLFGDPGDAGGQGTTAAMVIDGYKSLLGHSKRRIVADYVTLMDAYIAEAQRPFKVSDAPVSIPDDPFNRLMLPDIESARLKDLQMRTDGGLLVCVLALRAYLTRHGTYPASLQDVTADGILKRLPDDPFAGTAGKSFRYRRTTGDYILYSVGPDGIDDHGKPIALAGGNSSDVDLQSTDKGDRVANRDVGVSY